ncbi:MAG TPA: ATP-binding cassette domain-containing protein [Phycisphaerae bacterium]|nr:ATP-binding cassette domain-containing protein [Phycisphaerae bacterium]
MSEALLLDDVCKSFGPVRAVDHLSVRVPTGCVYGFLGPNGAGKTTTLRMVMDIIRPDSGRIEVLGDGRRTQQKSRIGYMPEERGLYRKMTAAKVLTYFGQIKGLDDRQVANRAGDWLERVGLAQAANRKVEDLSRGMHQKLQFAATCINEPDLVILDEPFSGLDPVNLDAIEGVILAMRGQGKTIIFSTHVMHEAERLCDRILLINKGRSIVDGTLDQIRARWQSRTVSLDLEGDSDFLTALPIVESVTPVNRGLEITLSPEADAQQLLAELVGRVRVLAFAVKVPSLHEIFVNLVGADSEQNS